MTIQDNKLNMNTTAQIPFDSFVTSLIKDGYTDDVRAFTKTIETKPRMVHDFEKTFNRLMGAWVDVLTD